MSIEIQVQTTEAQGNVGALTAGIDQLRTSLRDAYNDATKLDTAFSFSDGAAQTLASLRSEFSQFTQVLRDVKAEMSGFGQGGDSIIASAQGQSRAILGVAEALKQESQTMKAQAQATQELVDAEKNALQVRSQAVQIVQTVINAERSLETTIADLDTMRQKGTITEQQYQKSLELTTSSVRTAATAAEQLIESMTAQNSAFNQTSEALLRQTQGWATLTSAQRANLLYQNEIKEAINATRGILTEEVDASTRYAQQQQSLNTLLQEGVITQQQYDAALGKGYTELSQYMAKQEQAAARTRELTDAEKAQAAANAAVGQSMQRLAPLLQETSSAAGVYRQRLSDIAAASRAYISSNGEIGISAQATQRALAGARSEFIALAADEGRAALGAVEFGGSLDIVNQSAAAFRASLEGAGLGFGIFTGATILAATAAFALAHTVKTTLEAGAEFEQQMVRGAAFANDLTSAIDAQGNTIAIVGGKTKLLANQAQELATNYQFSSQEILEGAAKMQQASVSIEDTYASMRAVADLATISNSSFAESASNLVSISHLFGLSFQDANQTVGQLVVGITSARTSVESITKSLEYVGPIAREAGLSLGQTTAAIVTLNKGGIEADKAGTNLRALFNAIAKETPVARKALADLNLTFHDFYTKDGLDFVGMLEKIKTSIAGLSKEDQLKTLSALFRTQGQAGAVFLMQNLDDLKKFNDEMVKGAEKARALADAMNSTTLVAFKEFGNEIKNIEQDAFTNFDSGLYDSIKQLTQFLKDNSAQISQAISGMISGLLNFTKFILEHAGAITTLVEAYAALKAATILVETAMAAYAAIMGVVKAAQAAAAAESIALEAGIVGVGTATTATTAGMAGLGAAGSSALAAIGGPVTIVAAALAALGYAIYQLHDRFTLVPQDIKHITEEMDKLHAVEGQIATMNLDALKSFGHEAASGIAELNKQLLIAQENLEKYKAKATVNYAGTGMAGGLGPGGFFSPPTANNDPKYKELLDTLTKLQAQIDHMNTVEFEVQASELVHNSSLFNTYLQSASKSEQGLKSFGNQVKTAQEFLSGFRNVLTLLPKDFLALNTSSQGLQQLLSVMEQIINATKAQRAQNDAATKADENKARMQELATELHTIVSEYAKLNYSPDILIHSLNELTAITNALRSGASQASLELQKLGVSKAFAEQAIQASAVKTTFDQLKIGLGAISPLFGKVKQEMGDNVLQADSLSNAYALIDTAVATAKKNFPAAAGAIEQMGEGIKSQLAGIADGSADLEKKFNDLAKSAPAAFAKMLESTSTIDAYLHSLLGVNVALTEEQRLVAAEAIAHQEFAAAYKSTATEAERVNLFLQVNNELLDHNKLTVEQAAKAWQTFWASTPTGQLEKQNQNLQNQIAIISSGSNQLSVYNTLWQATKGDLSQVTDAMRAAAVEQQKLNEELKQVQQVQQIWQSFADNLTNVFKNVFNGTDKNFKSLVSDIKNQFKQLLIDLALAAIKNQIMLSMGITTQGNTGGFLNAIGNIFGGGSGGQTTTVSGPQPLTDGSAFNFNNLLQSSVAGSTGYDFSSATGGSAFGGTNLLSLASIGKTGFGMVTGGGSAAGSAAGGFDYFDSVFGGAGAGSTSAGGLSLAQNTAAGGINLSAGAGAGASPGFLGTAGSYGGFAGILGGISAGFGEYKAAGGGVGGLAGGIAYGVGTAALMGAASTAMTAGLAAGMAAIPVVGWIALAAMAINMISGGKLFGTAWKPTGSTTTYDIGQTDATLTSVTHETRQKAFFGGTAHKDVNNTVDPQAEAQAQQMFSDIQATGRQAQQQLGVTLDTMVEGSFQQLYDKKGKLTDQFSTVLGVIYHESIDDFVTREKAEQVVAAVGESVAELGGQANEASDIAQKFRSNASLLADAANAMLAAQLDIKNNNGLLQETGAGVLTRTMDLVSDLNQPGEKLADTYTRLVQSTQLMTTIFGNLGVQTSRTREEFVKFSAEVVQDLGGIQAAQQAWQSFTQSVFTATQQIASPTANTNLATTLGKIGVDVGISVAEFAEKFKENMPQMNDQQLADWIKAGSALGTIDNSMRMMAALAQGVDLSSVINQQQSVVNSLNALISAAAAAGASQEQLAQLELEAAQALQQQLDNFMSPIEEQLAKFTGRDYTFQLQKINEQMTANILQATQLGASEQQLSDIRALAAYQEAQIINQLQASLSEAVVKLFGTTTTTANNATAAAHNASHSVSAMADAQHQAQVDLYNQQMAIYEAEKDAIKTIGDFIKQTLTSALSPLDWQQQLNTAKQQFSTELVAAQGGDVNAIKDITQYAQTYLQQAQSAYGNSADYASIYQFVMAALQGLNVTFAGATAPTEPSQTGGANANSHSGASSSTTQNTPSDADRYALAVQVAQQIGELGLALNVSVFDLMKQYGVSIDSLAKAMHIDINKMDDDTITNLKILNGGLGTNMADLLVQLKVTPEQIGNYFKITASSLNSGNLTGLKELAKFLGTDIFTAMTYIGGNIKDVAKSLGLDIDALDANSVDNLLAIAKTLDVNASDLITALGISYTQLAQSFGIDISNFNGSMIAQFVTFATKLGLSITDAAGMVGLDISTLGTSIVDAVNAGLLTLPDLPTDFTDGLAPFLTEIQNAKTPEELKQAYEDLNNYLSNLPQALKDQITPLFTSLGFNLIQGDGGTQDVVSTQEDTNTILTGVGDKIDKGFDKIYGPISSQNSQFDAPISAVVGGLTDNYNMLTQISQHLGSGSAAAVSSAQSFATASSAQGTILAALTTPAAAQLYATAASINAATSTQQQAVANAHIAENRVLQKQVAVLIKVVQEGTAQTVQAQSGTKQAVDNLHKTTKTQKGDKGFKK